MTLEEAEKQVDEAWQRVRQATQEYEAATDRLEALKRSNRSSTFTPNATITDPYLGLAGVTSGTRCHSAPGEFDESRLVTFSSGFQTEMPATALKED